MSTELDSSSLFLIISLFKILNEQQIPNYEKLLILKAIPFKGHDYIIEVFDMEGNFYLKDIINNNPDSIFNKPPRSEPVFILT